MHFNGAFALATVMPYCEGQRSAIQTPPAPLQGVRWADIYAYGGVEIEY